MAPNQSEPLTIADRTFSSRVRVGTGTFSSNESRRDTFRASGSGSVKVALKRAHLKPEADPSTNILEYLEADGYYVLPDPFGPLKAAETLVKGGFTILPYIHADPALAQRLQDEGVSTVIPQGSPIGGNRGLDTRAQIEIIIEQARVPVAVERNREALYPSETNETILQEGDRIGYRGNCGGRINDQ